MDEENGCVSIGCGCITIVIILVISGKLVTSFLDSGFLEGLVKFILLLCFGALPLIIVIGAFFSQDD